MGSKPNTSSYETLCHSMQSHIVEVSDWRWEARVNIPTPLHTCGAGLMSLLRLQRASLRVCVHMCTVDAHMWHRLHHHTSFTSYHRIPACWLTPSPLTTVTAIAALQKTIINSQQREGLLLGGPLEYEKKKKKKKPESSWAADSCIPDVYVSGSRLTNEQTAISLNWD